MKFAKKLAIALWLGITVIYLVIGYDRFHREAALFETDMQRDHSVMGRGLGGAVAEVWEQEGRASALDLVERANQRESDILIRWADVAGISAEHTPTAPRHALDRVPSGEPATWVDRTGEGRLYTYVPLRVHDGSPSGTSWASWRRR